MNTEYKQRKNLTRFTYENTAFQGWRLCISREGKTFVKYFSDKKFGSMEAALLAAEKTLANIKNMLNESKKEHGKITKECISLIESSLSETGF